MLVLVVVLVAVLAEQFASFRTVSVGFLPDSGLTKDSIMAGSPNRARAELRSSAMGTESSRGRLGSWSPLGPGLSEMLWRRVFLDSDMVDQHDCEHKTFIQWEDVDLLPL